MTNQNDRTSIRGFLIMNSLTQNWLISQLAKRDVLIDKSNLSKILAGSLTGPKAELVVTNSLDIIKRYDHALNAED